MNINLTLPSSSGDHVTMDILACPSLKMAIHLDNKSPAKRLTSAEKKCTKLSATLYPRPDKSCLKEISYTPFK